MTLSEDQKFREAPPVDNTAHQQAVEELRAYAKRALPTDYLEFLSRCDGGEGFIGEGYFVIDGPKLAVGSNEAHAQFGNPLLFIGSDGGGEGLAFDLREGSWPQIVMAPFIGTDNESCWVPVAPSLADLLAGKFTDEFKVYFSV